MPSVKKTRKHIVGRKDRNMNREKLKELGLTDEQIEAIMSDHGKSIQAEKAKLEGYKSDSLKLVELTKQLEAMKKAQADKDKDLSAKDTAYDDLKKQFDELQADLKLKELKANLAEKGIIGDDAEKLVSSLSGGSIDVSILGEIIANREKSAVDAKVKELTDGATNPNGGKAKSSGDDEKPDDVKNAETINFGGLAENVQQTRDFYK